MSICKYFHTDHELDSKGRCQSCADAGDATRAGMHYGDYIAARDAARFRPIPPPVPKPEPVSRANAVKVCRICGKLITRPNAKVCPACKGESRRIYDREYKRTHQKQEGNAT